MTKENLNFFTWKWGDRPAFTPGSKRQKVYSAIRDAEQGIGKAELVRATSLDNREVSRALNWLLAHPKTCLVVFDKDDRQTNVDFVVSRIRLHLHYAQIQACDALIEWASKLSGENLSESIATSLAISLRECPFRALSVRYSDTDNEKIAQVATDWVDDLVRGHSLEFEARVHSVRRFELELAILGNVVNVVDLDQYRSFRNELVAAL